MSTMRHRFPIPLQTQYRRYTALYRNIFPLYKVNNDNDRQHQVIGNQNTNQSLLKESKYIRYFRISIKKTGKKQKYTNTRIKIKAGNTSIILCNMAYNDGYHCKKTYHTESIQLLFCHNASPLVRCDKHQADCRYCGSPERSCRLACPCSP